MSLVGPRPEMPFIAEKYSEIHRERLKILPGITGLWQVCERTNRSFDEMVSLDIDYVDRQSPLLDGKIVLRTLVTIFGRDGSYRDHKEVRDG